jgi:phage tail P2-like protein
MANLLPPNATTLERNVAVVNSRLGELPTPLRDLRNADTCPVELLPWLASELSVDLWGADWAEDQKRASIKTSLAVHRVKGTIGAVRRALGAIGFGARLQEWFNQIPQGTPFTYRLLLDVKQVGISREQMQTVQEVTAASKNLRSHLDSVVLTVSSTAAPRIATVSSIGSEIGVAYRAPSLDLLMTAAAEGMAETSAAVDLLHTHLHQKMTNPTYW